MGHKELLPPEPDVSPRPAAPGRPTLVRYQVLAFGCTLALIAYIYRVGFANLGHDLKEQFHLGDQEWGYLLAIFLLSYGAFEVPWGVLGDRFGARHVLAVVSVASALLTGAVALAVLVPGDRSISLPASLSWSAGQEVGYRLALPFAFLLALRFLFGAVQAGLFPPLSRAMADWMPVQERGTAQGLIWMTSRLGGFLAPLVLFYLVFWLGGWARAMAALTVLGILWTAAFWPWFRNRPEGMPQVNAAERARIAAGRAAAPPPGAARIPWRALLRSRSVWALCLMYGCSGFAGNFFVTFLPTYLRDHRHLTADQTKWLSGLPLACGIVGCGLGGLISDAIIRRTGNRRWARRVPGVVGLAGAGAAVLSTVWVRDPILLGVLLCLTFFGNDLTMGPAWAACADIGERCAGTLGGKMNMVGNLVGGTTGTLLTGYLLERHQVVAIFVVFACTFCLGSLAWFGVDVTRPLEAER
jgi:sugar phosphate permease